MSALLETAYIPGRTLYVVIHSGDQVWNKDALAFENYAQNNWAHYAVPMTEQAGSGYYSATYPSQIDALTLTTEIVYQQNGASPVLPGSAGGDSFLTMMQSQGANVQTIGGSGAAASALALSGATIVSGTAVSGTLSTTQMTTSLTNPTDNAYNGRVIIWTSGTLQNQASNITAYSHTNGLLTFATKPAAPTAGDTFIIV